MPPQFTKIFDEIKVLLVYKNSLIIRVINEETGL
jgi:hypothetical protein